MDNIESRVAAFFFPFLVVTTCVNPSPPSAVWVCVKIGAERRFLHISMPLRATEKQILFFPSVQSERSEAERAAAPPAWLRRRWGGSVERSGTRSHTCRSNPAGAENNKRRGLCRADGHGLRRSRAARQRPVSRADERPEQRGERTKSNSERSGAKRGVAHYCFW